MTTITVWLPLASAIIGLIMWKWLPGMAARVGEHLFWTGWLAFLLTAAHAVTVAVR